MTRRDTILMAILINAGLLVIFATAITQDPVQAPPSLHSETASAQEATRTVSTPGQLAHSPSTPLRATEDLDSLVTRYASTTEARTPAAAHPVPATVIASANPDGIVAISQDAPAAVRVAVPIEPLSVPAANGSQFLEITVKRGDTLDKIARANGTTVAALMETNALTSTRLQIGDVLKIAPAGTSATRTVAASTESTPSGGEFYTIRSGDNPWVVAMKFHVPLNDLLKLNDLDEDGARRLKPGDKIRIR